MNNVYAISNRTVVIKGGVKMVDGSEKQAVGTIEISFSADISKDKLLEDFNEFLVSGGSIKLLNFQDQEVELEVHGIEYKKFDEFS